MIKLGPSWTALHEAISNYAASRPDELSLVEGDSGLSYLQLEERVRDRAAWLFGLGLKRGERVGVLMAHTPDHVIIILAVSRLGVVHLSLSASDGDTVNANLLKHYAIACVITDNPRAAFHGTRMIFVERTTLYGTGPTQGDAIAVRPDEPWKIVQTSGSTGSPKAVLQTHGMELANQSRFVPPLSGESNVRFLLAVELKYTLGLRLCLRVLAAGGTLVLSGHDSGVANLARLMDLHSITHMHVTPFHGLKLATAFAARNVVPKSLRLVTLSTAVATGHTRAMVRKHLCRNLQVRYATNEVGGLTSADQDLLERFPETIGLPVPGVEIEVVDESGAPVAPGRPGHIRARGLDFPTSYIDNPAATVTAFRNGWYYPGDLGSLGQHGELYFRGRADHQINFNGIKIDPADIEWALEQHPAVRQAVAFVLPDPVHQDIPCAAVITEGAASGDELQRFARTKLGSKAPRLIAIMPEIPVRGVGKPDLNAIRSVVLSQLRKGS